MTRICHRHDIELAGNLLQCKFFHRNSQHLLVELQIIMPCAKLLFKRAVFSPACPFNQAFSELLVFIWEGLDSCSTLPL